jgi:hypothetical protein
MNFCAYSSIFALLLAGCLPPPGERIIPPKYIEQRVMEVKNWDVGCDNHGECTAITAVPPRKARMEGVRAALRIELGRMDEPTAGMTIIPLDFEQRLPDVKPTPAQAKEITAKLRDGRDFMIWFEDEGDRTSYYLLGQNFDAVEELYKRWLGKFPVRWTQEEAIIPTKALRLQNFRAPILSGDQIAECEAPSKGDVEAAWDVSSQIRLFKYDCSAPNSFYADSLWFLQDKESGTFSAIGIDEATGPKTDGKAAGLHNPHFEASQGLLVTRKISAAGDCGLIATYAATPSGFVLAERREARHCIGLFSGDWIRTYRSSAVILPEHW